jgi:hypothetical protein
MVATALAVPDDHDIGTDVGQHGSRNVAGIARLGCGVTILPTDADIRRFLAQGARNGKGGARATCTSGQRCAPRSMALASVSMARLPFIFQLPTI